MDGEHCLRGEAGALHEAALHEAAQQEVRTERGSLCL